MSCDRQVLASGFAPVHGKTRNQSRPNSKLQETLLTLSTAAPITTPAALLAASKHKLSQYESKLGDWNELFTKTGSELRDAGMSVQDRRYLLWLLEKYRCVFFSPRE